MIVRLRRLRYRLMIWHSRGWFAPFCWDCRWLRHARRIGEDYEHDDPRWYIDQIMERGERATLVRSRVEIDLNVRVRGNQTFTGIEDVRGPINVGDPVQVYESESGVVGSGRITEIDRERGIVYLTVDWDSLAVPGATYANGTGQNWAWTVEHGGRRIS